MFEFDDDLSRLDFGIVGYGDASTRLRRCGDGQRVLLQEGLNVDPLLQPSHNDLVQTLVKDGRPAVHVDGRLCFEHRDAKPPKDGWFGLRSTWSRQAISAVRIYALD